MRENILYNNIRNFFSLSPAEYHISTSPLFPFNMITDPCINFSIIYYSKKFQKNKFKNLPLILITVLIFPNNFYELRIQFEKLITLEIQLVKFLWLILIKFFIICSYQHTTLSSLVLPSSCSRSYAHQLEIIHTGDLSPSRICKRPLALPYAQMNLSRSAFRVRTISRNNAHALLSYLSSRARIMIFAYAHNRDIAIDAVRNLRATDVNSRGCSIIPCYSLAFIHCSSENKNL